MHLNPTDEEKFALLNLLTETIESDRHPLSPRIRTLRGVLAKFGPIVHAADGLFTQREKNYAG